MGAPRLFQKTVRPWRPVDQMGRGAEERRRPTQDTGQNGQAQQQSAFQRAIAAAATAANSGAAIGEEFASDGMDRLRNKRAPPRPPSPPPHLTQAPPMDADMAPRTGAADSRDPTGSRAPRAQLGAAAPRTRVRALPPLRGL